MLSAPLPSSSSPPTSSPSLSSSQPSSSRSLLSRIRPSSASFYCSSLQSARHSTSTLALISLAFLLLNFVVCLFIVSSIEREQHTSSYTPLAVSHSTASDPLQACEVSNPLRPCVTPSLLAANNGASIRSQLAQALESIASLRSALLASPATPTDTPTDSVVNAAVAPLPLSSSPQSPLEPYLIIGLPSVSRSSPVARQYLNHTLQSIRRQLPSDPNHPLFGRVHVYVMNNQMDGPHDMWQQLKVEMSGDSNFHFFTNDGQLRDATPEESDTGTANQPGYRIRKQTRDIVATMEAAKRRSLYYMFMEDDFTFCPSLLRLLPYLVNKAHVLHPDWFSLKFSFGMNGYVIHNNGDMDHLSAYLLHKQRLRPPDHLIVEWSAGEKESAQYKQDRPNIIYRYNMLHHLGTVSSLRAEQQGEYPPCWHEMNTQVVFEVESFRVNECGHTDISPCWSKQRIEQAREGNSEREEESSWPELFNIPSQWIDDAQKK